MSGLYTPSSGFVLVQGVAPTGRCDLVYLSQQEHLFAWGTEDNVLLGRAPDVAAEHLRALKLHGLLQTTQDSARLSGGERQGIYVARALARTDTSLFLDEPTTALEAERRTAMIALLRSSSARHRTLVFATHDPELAEVADYVLLLDEGSQVKFTEQARNAEATAHRAAADRPMQANALGSELDRPL